MRAQFKPPDTATPPFALPAERGASKYHAVKTVVDNITFASKAEARRYGELKLLEKAGYIRQLELQPVYEIKIDGKLVCKVIFDFRYWEGQVRTIEDVKGLDNPLSRLKRKLVEAMYPSTKIMLVK